MTKMTCIIIFEVVINLIHLSIILYRINLNRKVKSKIKAIMEQTQMKISEKETE